VPPLLGFFSKFYLFKLAIEQGHVTLTVIALLTSAVAAYYYLAVVALMYFKEPAADAEPPRAMGTVTTWVVGLSCALILLGICFGARLLDWAATIV
jgi:NADH-quinone oxidoreductase subunit N